MTFGSVSDWSEEEERTLEQSVMLDDNVAMETEDDDGIALLIIQRTEIECFTNQMMNLPRPSHPHRERWSQLMEAPPPRYPDLCRDQR